MSDLACRSVFMIDAVANPEVLLRVVNLFAQRDLIPRSLVLDANGEELSLCVVIDDLDQRAADLIAEKLRVSVLVEQVRVERFDRSEGKAVTLARAA